MPWQKGQSGNPNGRPGKDRALTEILERAGARMLERPDGRVARKRFMAEQIWGAITSGSVRFEDGREVLLSGRSWVDFVSWLYGHIDGPPSQQIDHGSDPDRPIRIQVQYEDDGDSTGRYDHLAPASPPLLAGPDDS